MLLGHTSLIRATIYSTPCQDRHPITSVPSSADVNSKRQRTVIRARMTNILIRRLIKANPSFSPHPRTKQAKFM